MTNWEKAQKRAEEIDEQILNVLRSGKSFRVEAGAGAGKTYSLEKVVQCISDEQREEFARNEQYVACITYTNVAAEVIRKRLPEDSFVRPSTIHAFAWSLMNQFQAALISLVEKLELSKTYNEKNILEPKIQRVVYSQGIRYVDEGTLFLSHNDVIDLFALILDNKKFRYILSNRYPVILIDEYQDSFEKIMSQFVKYFIEPEYGPQFGLFGDAWQTIYSASGACGLIESEKLKEIRKEANFRSEEVIVEALNRMRPELPQISALDQTDGKILVITTNNIDETNRIAKGRDKGDLKEEIRKDVVEKVQRKLQEQGWQENTKILMLTHKYLAMQQEYQRLYEVLGNHFRNQDDIHFQYFQNLVEPVFHALQNNDAKRLAEILGTSCSPVLSYNYKQKWNRFGRDLEKARKKVIYDVINIVADSGLLDVPPKIKAYKEQYEDGANTEYGEKTLKEFYEIPYEEVVKAIEFFAPESMFSTDHGVKGEQYENVLLVLGRGWSNYKFDETLYKVEESMSEAEKKKYVRNRNLFYVCCSRAEKRLAILITISTNEQFKEYLERIFGADVILEYGSFMEE